MYAPFDIKMHKKLNVHITHNYAINTKTNYTLNKDKVQTNVYNAHPLHVEFKSEEHKGKFEQHQSP